MRRECATRRRRRAGRRTVRPVLKNPPAATAPRPVGYDRRVRAMYPEPFLAALAGWSLETTSSRRLLDLQWPMFCRSAGDHPAPANGDEAVLLHEVIRHPQHQNNYHHGCYDISADYESSMRS